MQCKLQGILTSHFSGLDPFAGNLYAQLVSVFDCTKLLKYNFISAEQIGLLEIFASHFSGLDPFAGNL